MECTQKLDCSQNISGIQVEKVFPEQIGFLGICGEKYPIKKGPNKVGRDPQTCNIVLNVNTVSKQHAVINIINSKEFMIMDLDSANKTRLNDITLSPYIPKLLKNGDIVQFGQVFGIFNLLQEEDDLPLTQSIFVPETPTVKNVSRLNNGLSKIIQESPDTSDNDESIVVGSQTTTLNDFKRPNSQFLKPAGKSVTIQPVGMNRIDNIYWSSSKKSDSFDMELEDSKDMLNNSTLNDNDPLTTDSQNPMSIHEMDTQIPFTLAQIENTENSHVPMDSLCPSVNDLETKQPVVPKLCDINNHDETEFHAFTHNKNNNIYNSETQIILANESNDEIQQAIVNNEIDRQTSKMVTDSEEEIICDDFDNESFNGIESQTLLPPEMEMLCQVETEISDKAKAMNRVARVNSSSLINHEDFSILPTQKISEKNSEVMDYEKSKCVKQLSDSPGLEKVSDLKEDDSTDCEDEVIQNANKKSTTVDDNDETDCEDDYIPCNLQDSKRSKSSEDANLPSTTVGSVDDSKSVQKVTESSEVNFEDMATQIIREDNAQTSFLNSKDENICFEDLPTQVIEIAEENSHQNVSSLQVNTPFKVPLPSPIKIKGVNAKGIKTPIKLNKKSNSNCVDDEENYYKATQDIFYDLYSQQCPEQIESHATKTKLKSIKDNLLSKKSITDADKMDISSDNSDANLSMEKVLPCTLMITDLPSSQEINRNISQHNRKNSIELSSDSELDNDSEGHNINSIIFPNKKINATKSNNKITYDTDKLSTRVLNRHRKPTKRLLSSDKRTKKAASSILQSSLLTEQESDIDTEIILENKSRLKSNIEETRNKCVLKDNTSDKRSKNKLETENKTINKQEIIINSEHCHLQNIHSKQFQKINGDNKKSKKKSDKSNIENSCRESTIYGDTSVNSEKSSKTKEKDLNIDVSHQKDVKDSNKSKHNCSCSSKRGKRGGTRNKCSYCDTKNGIVNVMKNVESCDVIDNSATKRKCDKRLNNDAMCEKEVRRSKRIKTVKHNSVINSTVHSKTTDNQAKEDKQNMINSESSEIKVDLCIAKLSSTSKNVLDRNKSKACETTDDTLLKARSRNKKTHVLFTAFPHEEVKTKLQKLGAVLVTDVTACTVVVTYEIKRTFKFLCAIGLGRPIVGLPWVQACIDSKLIADPWLYLIKDDAAEKRYKFSLQKTLNGRRNFLKGYNISATPRVQPEAKEMKCIVECSGGSWKEGGRKWICVSCNADRALWKSLEQRGATIVTSEFIFGGVLRQTIDIENNRFQ